MPHLRNSIAYDHDFWYACVKYNIFWHFFHFLKFWIFRLLGGSKGKKWPKMTKRSVYCALDLRNHTSHDLHLWYTCVKDNISSFFLHLFQIFIFGVNCGVKGQRMAQNDKNSCLLHSYLRTYTWSQLLVQIIKMMPSLVLFSFFQNFNFPGC